jgi:hypothetical protein
MKKKGLWGGGLAPLWIYRARQQSSRQIHQDSLFCKSPALATQPALIQSSYRANGRSIASRCPQRFALRAAFGRLSPARPCLRLQSGCAAGTSSFVELFGETEDFTIRSRDPKNPKPAGLFGVRWLDRSLKPRHRLGHRLIQTYALVKSLILPLLTTTRSRWA